MEQRSPIGQNWHDIISDGKGRLTSCFGKGSIELHVLCDHTYVFLPLCPPEVCASHVAGDVEEDDALQPLW